MGVLELDRAVQYHSPACKVGDVLPFVSLVLLVSYHSLLLSGVVWVLTVVEWIGVVHDLTHHTLDWFRLVIPVDLKDGDLHHFELHL